VNRCAPRIVGNEQPELRAILGGTLDNMSTEIPKSKRLKQPFSKMDELLTARGYTKQKASGLFYWLWRLPNEFPLYCFNGKLGANKIFIDATFVDLAKVLSSVKGIVPPSGGTTKNHKFEVFQFKRVNPYRGTTEYEGWKFVFRDSDAAAKFLDICEAFAREGLDAAQQVACQFEQIPSPKTDKKALTEVRIGQQDFRKRLLKYWKTCAVTGCTVSGLLRASHIKPWSIADSSERLDLFNGLLLVPNLDALFDSGLITFDDEGKIIISSLLPVSSYDALGLSETMYLRKFNTAHSPYIEFHRRQIFKP